MDDKAKIPLGLAAATKQAPILMHLEYKVRLPDHDFAVAARHKLIPSVYAACVINPDKFTDAVSYSGPTYIAIRSMKHDSSTAFTHGHDLERLRSVDSFKTVMSTPDGQVKPIFIVASDCGPDENPRFLKPLQVTIARFKTLNLDACLTAVPMYLTTQHTIEWRDIWHHLVVNWQAWCYLMTTSVHILMPLGKQWTQKKRS